MGSNTTITVPGAPLQRRAAHVHRFRGGTLDTCGGGDYYDPQSALEQQRAGAGIDVMDRPDFISLSASQPRRSAARNDVVTVDQLSTPSTTANAAPSRCRCCHSHPLLDQTAGSLCRARGKRLRLLRHPGLGDFDFVPRDIIDGRVQISLFDGTGFSGLRYCFSTISTGRIPARTARRGPQLRDLQ